MYLVLGDWSNDGHGKSSEILLESNKTVKDIQLTYKRSVKLTGVNFSKDVCGGYEDSKLSKPVYDKFCTFGLTKELLMSFDEGELEIEDFESGGELRLSQEMFIKLWIWFVKLSDPELQINIVEDDIPPINGYWSTVLNENFGYGLYE